MQIQGLLSRVWFDQFIPNPATAAILKTNF